MSVAFRFLSVSPGLLRPSIALATSRAGGLGILDFEYVRDHEAALQAILKFNEALGVPFGVKLGSQSLEIADKLLASMPEWLRVVVFTSANPSEFETHIALLRERNVATLLEATCLEHAQTGFAMGVDGLIAKGHEAGGRVADETTFLLLQRFKAEVDLPVWPYGGIGLHTSVACAAGGAAGLVLDSQLALTRESPFSERLKAWIGSMDGSETVCLGEQLGEAYRMYFRPGNPVVKELQDLERRLSCDTRSHEQILADWREAVLDRAGWNPDQDLLLLGQDAAFASNLANRFQSVGGVIQGLRSAIQSQLASAGSLQPLAPGSAMATSHGTRYPIMQGPMTRVSDVPEFALRVAEEGALPFLALALLRGPEVQKLLKDAQVQIGSRPWGVGILGFVPQELRQEQLKVVLEYRPPFALIAGGRPDQARELEQQGIATYLHVPSPGLLQMFIQQGARRLVFEGRECGGHVGPRSSFVLWNQMIDVLLASSELQAKPEDFHIVFAAGIHDALSAAMVSAMAAPLAARGARVGVLLGTAYLFTEEAVASGAIQKTFQEQAEKCRRTVLLETGPGHSTRCVDTPYAADFFAEKRRLLAAGHPAEEIREQLEGLNLGRLRIASKGLTRNADHAQDRATRKLIEVGAEDQIAQGMYMIGQVAALRHSVCTMRTLHHDVSVGGTKLLDELTGHAWQPVSTRKSESPSDVAIIGMGCVLPKAPDLQTYWENILQKVNAVGEIPKERWDSSRYFDADPKAKDKIYSQWGGFLDDVAFDPIQYGMPPSSLRSIEPAQLLTLEVVRAALEDAGYADRPFARDRTSVILGAGGGAADLGLGYGARSFIPMLEDLPEFQGRTAEILERMGDGLPEWTEDSFAGILTNVAAGRVANRFNLGGSNYTVDAACASSLAAVSLALKELEGHTSDMVIVGGVDTMQNPFTYLCFSKTHALSPRGRCRTFDESADGIAISEGIAVMVFKRLRDAERDGDRIYAVIKGAGSSSDGKDRGLTAPRPEGQAVALERAYSKAGVSPASVGLVEAHGTGTVAGDGAEVRALTQVFSAARAARQSCAVGSVKSMIGHAKCAAGAAGLIKAALALHHKVLPPTLGVENPNPRAKFPETPFFVNTDSRPWFENSGGVPRRAGVSAFGFGGTNFHIVLEEYTGDLFSAPVAPRREWAQELFLWKGENREALLRKVEEWEKALSVNAKPKLRDLAYTAWKQSEGIGLQLAIVASSVDDLKEKLGLARTSLSRPETTSIHDPRGIYFSQQPLAAKGKLAFLFPGQGSQYPQMLRDLLLHFPETREPFQQAALALTEKLDQSLINYVFPPPAFSREEERSRQQALTQTNVAQPALGAASLALLGLLKELGLNPDMLAGHSYGEYVALAAAGVFDVEKLAAISEARGRFIVEGAGEEPGTMAAVEADAAEITEALRRFEGVCLANANAPKQNVISGPRAAVKLAVDYFSAQGVTARLIPVACAFHSPLVESAKSRLADFLSAVELREPRIPVYSNTTGTPYPQGSQSIRNRLEEHLVRPVEFVREIEAMYQAGARVFVEVGPKSVLTGLVEQILGNRPKLAVASDQSGRSGLTQLLHLVGQLSAEGYSLNLERLFRDRSDRRHTLSALQRECAPKPLPASVWLVNGSRAKPLKESGTKRKPSQAFTNGHAASVSHHTVEKVKTFPTPPITATATASHSNGVSPSMPPLHRKTTADTPVAIAEAPISAVQPAFPDAGGVPQVMLQFQQTMTRFLDTQKHIMLKYLEPGQQVAVHQGNLFVAAETPVYASPAVEPLAKSAPATVPLPVHNEHVPVAPEIHHVQQPVRASSPAPVSASPTAPMVPGTAELLSQLLAIVGERTGYPLEMLDPKLDLEADLGIDSIKRVEILGALQQSVTASGVRVEEGLMEKLAGIRSLHDIVARVAEHLGSPSPVVAAPVTVHQEVVPVVSGPDRIRLTSHLLSVVSERTGYPPEMLDLNLDLEADLGIDSIKRVEILGTFQQSSLLAGGGETGLMEKLSGVRTLQGIIDRVLGHMGPGSTPHSVPEKVQVVKSAPVNKGDSEDEIRRFTLTAVETPRSGSLVSLSKRTTILVIGEHHPAGRVLTRDLLEHGYTVATVQQAGAVHEISLAKYSADLHSPESLAELLALVSLRQSPVGGVIFLSPLEGAPNLIGADLHTWQEQLHTGGRSLFQIAKAAGRYLHAAAAEHGAFFLAATGMGGSFMSGPSAGLSADFPDHGAVVGLMKTLALEWPEVRVKSVDLNLNEPSDLLAKHLFAEVHATDRVIEVGYDGGRRVSIQPLEAPVNRQAVPISLDSSAVVLITGGARGITAIAARKMAELYQPVIILAGRSPLPDTDEAAETAGISGLKVLKSALMNQMRAAGETATPLLIERAYLRLMAEREIRANLSVLQQIGARVHYHQVDVRDLEQFASFIDGIYGSFGRLDAVIHGAGVIEDKLVEDKSAESFDRVFDTKVNAALVLSRKLRPENLKLLVFFSSVSGRFGNRGQGDYAAANEVLNKLAVCLDRDWPGRVVAINWGPWDTDGMVTDEIRKQFNERGVKLISSAAGASRFEEEVQFGQKGEAEVVVGGGTFPSLTEPEAVRGLAPLLADTSFSRTGSVMEFVRELSPAYDLYLDDHRLDGQPVLPLAVATEFMAEAAAHGWPDMRVASVRNLRLLNGVVLESGAKQVRIVVKSPAGAQSSTVPGVTSVAVEITGTHQPRRVHYSATVDLMSQLVAAPQFSLPALIDGGNLSLSIPELYERWLFHGPLFQGIVSVDKIGSGGMSALLATSSPKGWIAAPSQGEWLIDPLMFDCALQLLLVWSREHWNMTALPTGFQSFRRFAAAVPSKVACEMRLRENTGGQTIHADIYFLDPATGDIFAVLEDMQGACSAALNRLAGRKPLAIAGNPA